MKRRKPSSDAELSSAIGLAPHDRVASMIGRTYSRAAIERLEEQRVPWLRRRRWRRQQAPSG